MPGVPSRLLATRLRVALDLCRATAVAPGQMPAARMRDEFRFRDDRRRDAALRRRQPHRDALAVAGRCTTPRSRPPGIDAVYVPLTTDDFDDFLAFAEAMGVEGASVTIPFKLDALRAAAGARSRSRRRWAPPTRCAGGAAAGGRRPTPTSTAFWRRSRRAFGDAAAPGARASVLGAGGSARAVVAALRVARRARDACTRGARSRRASVAASLGARRGAVAAAAGSWDLLVNCTPLGGAGRRDESPLPGGPFDGRAGLRPDLRRRRLARCVRRGARAPDARCSTGCRCWSRRPSGSSSGGRGSGRAPGVMRAAATRRWGGRRRRDERSRWGSDADHDVRRSSRNWRSAARSCRSTRRSSPTC